jgi:hypothetical protein
MPAMPATLVMQGAGWGSQSEQFSSAGPILIRRADELQAGEHGFIAETPVRRRNEREFD